MAVRKSARTLESVTQTPPSTNEARMSALSDSLTVLGAAWSQLRATSSERATQGKAAQQGSRAWESTHAQPHSVTEPPLRRVQIRRENHINNGEWNTTHASPTRAANRHAGIARGDRERRKKNTGNSHTRTHVSCSQPALCSAVASMDSADSSGCGMRLCARFVHSSTRTSGPCSDGSTRCTVIVKGSSSAAVAESRGPGNVFFKGNNDNGVEVGTVAVETGEESGQSTHTNGKGGLRTQETQACERQKGRS